MTRHYFATGTSAHVKLARLHAGRILIAVTFLPLCSQIVLAAGSDDPMGDLNFQNRLEQNIPQTSVEPYRAPNPQVRRPQKRKKQDVKGKRPATQE